MDELRVMLEEESSNLPTEALKLDDSKSKNIRFERGPSLLHEIQKELNAENPQAGDSAQRLANKGEQNTADKRRAFAFRPGMHIMEYGEMLDGGAPEILPANTVCRKRREPIARVPPPLATTSRARTTRAQPPQQHAACRSHPSR
jgi:hypothetical protein